MSMPLHDLRAGFWRYMAPEMEKTGTAPGYWSVIAPSDSLPRGAHGWKPTWEASNGRWAYLYRAGRQAGGLHCVDFYISPFPSGNRQKPCIGPRFWVKSLNTWKNWEDPADSSTRDKGAPPNRSARLASAQTAKARCLVWTFEPPTD